MFNIGRLQISFWLAIFLPIVCNILILYICLSVIFFSHLFYFLPLSFFFFFLGYLLFVCNHQQSPSLPLFLIKDKMFIFLPLRCNEHIFLYEKSLKILHIFPIMIVIEVERFFFFAVCLLLPDSCHKLKRFFSSSREEYIYNSNTPLFLILFAMALMVTEFDSHWSSHTYINIYWNFFFFSFILIISV